MKKIILFTILSIGFFTYLNAQCDDFYDVVVAQDGSGDFTTVQAAIDAAPGTGPESWVIYIKNGEYDEKLYIEKSFLTFIGEDRQLTIVKTAELRRIWYDANGTDWGAATVNISDNATDLMFANMTILNNFADVFPTTPDPHDHTFTIRGGGNRVIIINCDIVSTGGDTCSLWNNGNDGMYYHRGSFFTGWVDYLCPRGYCYVEGCDFYGYNNNASIWHDGSDNYDHKFVLRDNRFDGVVGFALGRYHLDGHFYLIDNYFTKNMQNREIYHAESGPPLTWDERVYYFNCNRENGDYDWHANNLEDSEISDPNEATAQWTFQNQWDPESLIVGVVSYPSMPRPVNGKKEVPLDQTLGWIAGRCAASFDLYFGTDSTNLQFMGNQDSLSFDPDITEECVQYFWRIDQIDVNNDTITGEIWNFTTQYTTPPPMVSNLLPLNGSEVSGSSTWLRWEGDLVKTDSFRIYFGKEGELDYLTRTQKDSFKVFSLDIGNTYEWRIDAKNENGVTQGEVWTFSYGTVGTDELENQKNKILQGITPNPASDLINIEYQLSSAGKVDLQVLNLEGKVMDTLFSGHLSSGEHVSTFSIETLPAGIYLCRFDFQNKIEVLRFIVE